MAASASGINRVDPAEDPITEINGTGVARSTKLFEEAIATLASRG
jgi:hypothetical protein